MTYLHSKVISERKAGYGIYICAHTENFSVLYHNVVNVLWKT